MTTWDNEPMQAEQVSAAIDDMIRRPEAGGADEPALETARALAAMVQRLPPPRPELVRRVAALGRQTAPRRRPRAAWAVAALAAVLLFGTLLTPAGQTAVASFMAVFNLGRTEVRITPGDLTATAAVTPASTAVIEEMTLDEARRRVGFPVPAPAYLPAGYELASVRSFTYPDLPAWVPQPFSVELAFSDAGAHKAVLTVYPIMLGDRASISHLNLEATPIEEVRDVEVNGQPAVLLRLERGGAQFAWQEVVWERGDLVLSLSAGDLSEEELLKMARSVR